VPGHHLQGGYAKVQAGSLSRLQRNMFIPGHGEGWALYAEQLCDEFGWFRNADERLGFLGGQILRTVRVIIDIGMHLGYRIPAGTTLNDGTPFHGGEVWNADLALEFAVKETGNTEEFMRSEIDRAAIPQVSMAGGTPVTADPLDPLVYQTPWSNNLVIPYTLEYMKRQGIEKIAIISDSGGFGKDGAAVIKATAPGAGMTVVEEQTFNPGDTDMSAQLTKIKGSGADAMIVVSAGKEAAIVVKNAADLGIKMPMFGTHGNARVEFIDGAGSAAEGFKFAAGKILLPELYGEGTEPFKVATDFKDRYTAAYNKAPDTFAGHAYDAINIIANAANKIDGEVTPKALRDEIEKTSGLIGIGGTFNFTPTDHNGMTTSDLSMYEIKDAAWIEAK
jgi:branched-chain amino acid transport system substrate-binding protein